MIEIIITIETVQHLKVFIHEFVHVKVLKKGELVNFIFYYIVYKYIDCFGNVVVTVPVICQDVFPM